MGLSPTSGLGGAGLGGAGIGGAGISKGAAAPAYVGPLDIVSGAAVAYSATRALSSANRGTANFTIVGYLAEGSQSFSSDSETGLIDAAAVNAFVVAAGGACQLWNDQSGNGLDSGEISLQAGPTWESSGLNSLPTFNFELGGGPLVTDAGVPFPECAYTVIVVVKQNGGAGNQGIFGNGFSGAAPYFDFYIDTAVPELQVEVFQTSPEIAYTYALYPDAGLLSATYLLAVSWTPGSRLCKLNGTTITPSVFEDSAQPVGSFTEIMAIGARALTGENKLIGTISELIVYPTNLSEANLNLVSQNIATFYGITLS